MLHVLTAGVGSTCEVRVRSGSAFEGIFKTLSSKFELALDAVHRRAPLPPPDTPGRGPRREDIVDTMIFRAGDVVLARLRNVDFAFAAREKFGGGAGARLNGEHKEKVLQRWEGGDGAHDYDLDADLSNGWDPNEMFKFNEEAYGVRSSYDSSLAAYTVPLERGSSPAFRQREARAAALAREIEAGPRHRRDDGDDEEGGGGEEERPGGPPRTPAPPGPPSGRDSPAGAAPRESKYPPLPQRVRGGGGLRCGSARGGGGRPGGGSLPPPRGAPPHPHPEPGLNGGPSRMSPKSQRPLRGGGGKAAAGGGARPAETPPAPPAAGRMYPPRSPKAAAPPPQDPPGGDPRGEGPPPNPPPSPQAGGAPPPPKEPLPPPGAKDGGRALEAPGPPEPPRAPGKGGPQAEPQRSQLEELRKFGAQFKLQPSSAAEPPPEPLPPRGPEPPEGRGRGPEGPPEAEGGAEEKGGGAGTPPGTPPGKGEGEEKEEGPVAEQVKKSTLNPNAKEFNPSKPLLAVNKSASTPTSPGPRAHPSPSLGVLAAAGGGGGVYGPPYISYIPQLHVGPAPVQAPQMYPYPVSGAQQGKYRGAKGSLPLQRSEQHPPASAPPPLVPAAAAGPPLVAAAPPPPYSSYISYGPQQFGGQPPLVQPLPHYPSQPVFAPMLPGSPRLLPSGSHPPPAIVSSSAPQYPPAEQPPPPQTLYAAVHQPYPPHAAPLHPQPPPTPTGAQPPPQHAAPSPAQHQGGQPPHLGGAQPQQPPQQSLFHAAAALGAAPPALPPPPAPPGAPSPQSSFPPPAPPPPPPPPPAAAAAPRTGPAMGDAGSERSKAPSLPPRCPCGFWGSSKTMNLCSKCFAEKRNPHNEKDFQKKQPDDDSTPSTSNSQSDLFSGETNSDNSNTSLTTQAANSNQQLLTELNVTSPSKEECGPCTGTAHASLTTPTKRSCDSDSQSESEASPVKRPRLLDDSNDRPEETSRSKQKSRRRCFQCQTKLELVQQELGSCRCGYVFCMLHRLPEQHDCTFDHMGRGREEAIMKMVKLDRKVGRSCQRIGEGCS